MVSIAEQFKKACEHSEDETFKQTKRILEGRKKSPYSGTHITKNPFHIGSYKVGAFDEYERLLPLLEAAAQVIEAAELTELRDGPGGEYIIACGLKDALNRLREVLGNE